MARAVIVLHALGAINAGEEAFRLALGAVGAFRRSLGRIERASTFTIADFSINFGALVVALFTFVLIFAFALAICGGVAGAMAVAGTSRAVESRALLVAERSEVAFEADFTLVSSPVAVVVHVALARA